MAGELPGLTLSLPMRMKTAALEASVARVDLQLKFELCFWQQLEFSSLIQTHQQALMGAQGETWESKPAAGREVAV